MDAPEQVYDLRDLIYTQLQKVEEEEGLEFLIPSGTTIKVLYKGRNLEVEVRDGKKGD